MIDLYMKKTACFLITLLCIMGVQGCSLPMNDGRVAPNEQTKLTPVEAFDSAVSSADEALQWCYDKAIVVFEDLSCTSGREVWNEFYNLVNKGETASVLCAHYCSLKDRNVDTAMYDEGKEPYPMLVFNLISYDGNEYRIRGRISSEKTADNDIKYKHLLHFEGKNSSKAQHKYYDEYYLVNDSSVTREQIQRSVYSSQAEVWIEHATVYCDWHD